MLVNPWLTTAAPFAPRRAPRRRLQPLAELEEEPEPGAELVIEEVGVLAVLLPQQAHGELAHGEHRVRLQRDEGREARHRVDQTLPQHDLR
jgi:hypothetical protein